MRKIKAFTALLLAASMVLAFTSCSSSTVTSKMLQYNTDGTVIMPKDGEQIAVISVQDYGDITIRFFPEEAPKAVENFTGLAKQGYFNGQTFHRVIENFMIQGGDPTGTGRGGQSIYGSEFKNEISNNLFNYIGAVAMANSGKDTNGSQYYINSGSSSEITDDFISYIKGLDESKLTYRVTNFGEEVASIYKKVGGNPILDGGYTVFGQVISGLDVVQAISKTETGEGDAPVKQVTVTSVTVLEYQAK